MIGYDKGHANFVLPVGWSATLELSNKSATPHDVALTRSLKVRLTPVPQTGSLSPVALPSPTPLASGSFASDETLAQPFDSNAPDRYYLPPRYTKQWNCSRRTSRVMTSPRRAAPRWDGPATSR
jgi:hypothetical protein